MNLPHPIMRHTAPALLRYVLVSFGVSVLLTRLYLQLTGFPKLGFGGLHIAHLLWGVLALIIAALLMLIYASPGLRKVAAVLTGIGIGLFIDEVGKFITSDNNYFYQPAAPIIYLCFLLVALIYERAALSQRETTDRETLSAALDDVESFIEGNPYAIQRIELNTTLKQLRGKTHNSEYVALADALERFATSAATRPGEARLRSIITRIEGRAQRYFNKHEHVLTVLLVAVLAVRVAVLAVVLLLVAGPVLSVLVGLVQPDATVVVVPSILIVTALRAVTDLILLAGLILFVFRNSVRGLYWMQTALMLSLCVIQVFSFYQDQFVAVAGVFGDLIPLLFLRVYLFRKTTQQPHSQLAQVDV